MMYMSVLCRVLQVGNPSLLYSKPPTDEAPLLISKSPTRTQLHGCRHLVLHC